MNEIIKIILIGDTAVGKSAFVSKLCGLSEREIKNQRVTVGPDITVFKITYNNDKYITLCLWDCGGYKNLKAFHKIFFEEASGIIMMYNLSSPSVQIVKKMYDDINTNSSNVPKILIGSKSDLPFCHENYVITPNLSFNIQEPREKCVSIIEKMIEKIYNIPINIDSIIYIS